MSTDPDQQEVEVADASAGTEGPPALRILKGNPTPEELAALVAIVAARSAAAAAATPAPVRRRSEWGHPARAVRGSHRPGPDQWRRSSWG